VSAKISKTMNDARSKQTFGRTSRILNAKEYAAVMRARLRIGGTLFVGHVLSRGDVAPWRLGLIVPKRFEPSAVRRNAVKRVWRDSFRRESEGLLALNHGHDVVIRLVAKPKAGPLLALKRACRGEARALLEKLPRSVR
jgi:ribonuclease P protein component